MTETGLVLEQVDFSYGTTPVLKNISVAFRPGCLTAICGPNGSGKSTLLRIASGQLKPDLGLATLQGGDVANMNPKNRAQKMALLPQTPTAPPELIVKDLVALGRFARRRPLAALTVADKEAIATALAATEMTAFADRALSQLSGGQRQRAWIAMVLAQEASLILLDEPTNHLDVAHAVETMNLLSQLVAEKNKTVVVVLHDINLMASHADDVVLMKNGEIVGHGGFNATVSESVMSSLYDRHCVFGTAKGRSRPFIVVT